VGKRLWEVLAIESDDGHCYALEFLGSVPKAQEKLAMAMLSWLEQVIPSNGPPRKEPHCKAIGKESLRAQEKPGARTGDAHLMVRARRESRGLHADQGEIDQAIEMRERYFRARDSGQLTVVDV
jgi:hypothetical protein